MTTDDGGQEDSTAHCNHGRGFHNFNRLYRGNPRVRVVAFTAAQIPAIAGRCYHPELAGPGHPNGIPILEESELGRLIAEGNIDRVEFAYSDVSNATVMHVASREVLAAGSDFCLAGPRRTMIEARKPVNAVSAVRTGCGKSQTCCWSSRRLRDRDIRAAVIRHPMPLERQTVQRFDSSASLDAARCTSRTARSTSRTSRPGMSFSRGLAAMARNDDQSVERFRDADIAERSVATRYDDAAIHRGADTISGFSRTAIQKALQPNKKRRAPSRPPMHGCHAS